VTRRLRHQPDGGSEDRPAPRLIECDPIHCDTILRRFERVTGKQATHAASAMRFEDISQERAAPEASAEKQHR
jgi:ribosomal protein S21